MRRPSTALARRVMRAEIAAQLMWTQGDPALARRYGHALAWRGGVACFSERVPLFGARRFGHKAVGLGVLAPATERSLARIVRHYDALGLPARLALSEKVVGRDVIRLVRRAGFQRDEDKFHFHLLHASARAVVEVPGIAISRVTPDGAAEFSRTAARGFGDSGAAARYFERVRVAALREHPRRAIAVIARNARGAPVGTGFLIVAHGVGSLYSGSVLPRWRGRGIQTALIQARVRIGLARGVRTFISQTNRPNSPSAHNLRDGGFRPLWTMTHWTRDVRSR